MASWVLEYARALDTAPEVWGLHNYRGVNAFSASSTEAFLRVVPGPVWLTETGGIVALRRNDGGMSMTNDEQRAADVLDLLFDLVDEHAGRIQRVYVYNLGAALPDKHFDSGLLRLDGSARPGLPIVLARMGAAPLPVAPRPALGGDPAPALPALGDVPPAPQRPGGTTGAAPPPAARRP